MLDKLLDLHQLPEELAREIFWFVHATPFSDAVTEDERYIHFVSALDYFLLRTPFIHGVFRVPWYKLANLGKNELYSLQNEGAAYRYVDRLDRYWSDSQGDLLKLVNPRWRKILSFRLPFGIPARTRFEHMHVLGATGSGKTQLLQRLIAEDLKEQATVIVMAPKGTMIPTIMGLRDVDPDRYVIIDPVDSVEHPLAINLFDVGQHEIQSKVEREAHLNQAVALLNYVFASILDAETTSKQSGFINYCLRLMLHIPGATLLTFREILGEAGISKYVQFVQSLSPIAQDFFINRFADKKMYGETKQQILWRLDALLENSTIAGLFTQTQSGLNLRREIEQNKVILIDTSIKHLTATGSSFFGRFWLALITLASQQRDPTQALNPVYVYLDEAHGYLGENIETILEQAREARVSLTLAHQQLSQLKELEPSVITNTATKFVGGEVKDPDEARRLGAILRVDPQVLRNQQILNFHVHIGGVTKAAVPTVVKPGYLEGLPKRSKRELQALRQANRDRYAVREVPQPEPPQPTPIHTETSDDFEDLNRT